jgi:hypothetical protein
VRGKKGVPERQRILCLEYLVLAGSLLGSADQSVWVPAQFRSYLYSIFVYNVCTISFRSFWVMVGVRNGRKMYS